MSTQFCSSSPPSPPRNNASPGAKIDQSVEFVRPVIDDHGQQIGGRNQLKLLANRELECRHGDVDAGDTGIADADRTLVNRMRLPGAA